MKYSKYFGAKWCGFIKSESILAPKGASRFKTQNIRYDKRTRWQHLSWSKASAFLSLQQKILVAKKHYNLYLRLVMPSGG